MQQPSLPKPFGDMTRTGRRAFIDNVPAMGIDNLPAARLDASTGR